MESNIEIFIENEEGKLFMLDCPKETNYSELRKLIKAKKFTELNYFFIIFKGVSYDDKNLNEILKLEEGDRITIVNEREDEGGIFANFHPNVSLNESDLKIEPLTGILRLILIKYICSFITDVSKFSTEIKKIIFELKKGMKLENDPQKDIKANLEEDKGHNILAYTKYVCSVIDDKEINNMMKQIQQNKKNDIIKYWSLLSKYEEFNKLFEVELYKAIEKSYFDYSLIGLSLYEQANRKQYLKEMEKCPNCVVRYLFHGTQIDPISKIITTGFLYTRKAFYGMGIYFSDMLDYISFYAGGKDYDTRRQNFNKILPINETFSCVSAEVYYSQSKKKEIFDFSLHVPTLDHFPTYDEIRLNYKDKMVEKNGVHFAKVEPNQGQVRKRDEIINDTKKGKFLGTEYVITEFSQILPLYGLTFKRNEYFVIWRDPHFKGDNEFSNYLKERKLFIYETAKMNAYFESNTEKALEIIKRKKFNKIILISNIGLDLGGKKFVEVARKILGFNVMVLFFSANRNHFSWLKEFPNALYTDNSDFYKQYILKYNEEGLLNLKKEVENHYKINLKFDKDFLKFPHFINQEKYDDIFFGEPSPNFKKVIIKNSYNNSILCMNDNRKPYFDLNNKLEINLFVWYVTLLGDEITLYSNGSYLGADTDSNKAIGEEFMKKFKFEKINNNEYLIYYDDKNHVLTINGDELILAKEYFLSKSNQKFKFIEETDNI